MFDIDPELHTRRSSAPARPPSRHHDPGAAGVLGLQRAAGNASVASLLQRAAEPDEESPVRDLKRRGGGNPMDGSTRRFMESRLGADFGDVRIHTGPEATEAARSVQAYAYTSGSDIVFRDGSYNPSSSEGQKMLAHELTHVIQQRSGPVDGTPAPGGLSISDPSDRFERAAEAAAEQAMAGGPAPQAAGSGGGVRLEEEEEPAQLSAVQRQEGDELEEQELQTSSLQRQEEGELEEEEVP